MSTHVGRTEEHGDFSTANAAASLTTPAQASSLRKGGHILLQDHHPCKIAEMSTSKPGKHGHAKVKLSAYDIFTHQKYEEVKPAHAVVEVPVVTRREYLVVDIDDDDEAAAADRVKRNGFLSLFVLESGNTREDLRCPKGEVGARIMELFRKGGKDIFAVVLGAMNEELVVDVREVERL